MKIAIPNRQITSQGITDAKEYKIKLGAHTMMLFSDLYSDPIWAIVREYATNMLDGYTKLRKLFPNAKIINPEIHLPNTLSPHIVFKDYGIGMDFDTVWDVFTSYGDSTKQDNNDEVGGLGIGSKVAFAYRGADQWVIESRFHGKRMVFNALRNAQGIPTLQHIATVDTDEPNGVTIQIPVARTDFNAFRAATEKLATFYPMGLEVSGDANYKKPVLDYFMRDTTWGITKLRNQSRIIMGNIPYPLDLTKLKANGSVRFLTENSYSLSVDLYMPVGSLDIVPSREALMYTDRTQQNLLPALDTLLADLKTKAENEIATAPSLWEATKRLYEAWGVGGLRKWLGAAQWNGQTIDAMNGITVKLAALRALYPDLQIEQYTNKDQKAHFGRYTVTEDIQLTPDMQLWAYVDDTGKYNGPVRRVRKMLIDKFVTVRSWSSRKVANGVGTAYVFNAAGLTPEKLSELLGGFPVENVTTLPEPVYDRTSGPRTKTSLKQFNFDRRDGSWDDADVDVEEGGFFVRLEGGNMLEKNEYTLDLIIKAARTAGIMEVDQAVYGIPRSRANVEKKEGWVEFFGWITPQVTPLVKAVGVDAANLTAWDDALDTTIVEFMLLDGVYEAVKEARPRSPLLKLADAARAVKETRSTVENLTTLAAYLDVKVPERKPTNTPEAYLAAVNEKHDTLMFMVKMSEQGYRPQQLLRENLPMVIKLLGM